MTILFTSPTWGEMTLSQMTDNLRSYIEEDSKSMHKIIIGTDSQTSRHGTMFVTAVVVHRLGRGARFFFRKTRSKPLHDLRYRIYKETEMSLELVERLKKEGFTNLAADLPIEIHIDIGQKGDTKVLIQEISGWVTSVGYVAKIKPQSYGASAVADRFTS